MRRGGEGRCGAGPDQSPGRGADSGDGAGSRLRFLCGDVPSADQVRPDHRRICPVGEELPRAGRAGAGSGAAFRMETKHASGGNGSALGGALPELRDLPLRPGLCRNLRLRGHQSVRGKGDNPALRIYRRALAGRRRTGPEDAGEGDPGDPFPAGLVYPHLFQTRGNALLRGTDAYSGAGNRGPRSGGADAAGRGPGNAPGPVRVGEMDNGTLYDRRTAGDGLVQEGEPGREAVSGELRGTAGSLPERKRTLPDV